MTTEEFDEKYKDYLEPGHYGLAIMDPRVINYLDKMFQEFIKVPGFSYSQIKLKFGMARFYAEPRELDTESVEQEINKILKK